MTIGKVQLAELARQAVGGLTTAQSLAIAELQHKAITKSESHDLRKARYLRKLIGRQLGKAGETIHQLRGEVAQLRLRNQGMMNAAIEDLIRDAVLTAVPVELKEDGTVVVTPSPANLEAATRDDDKLAPADDVPAAAGQ